jgi:hypothetical protein
VWGLNLIPIIPDVPSQHLPQDHNAILPLFFFLVIKYAAAAPSKTKTAIATSGRLNMLMIIAPTKSDTSIVDIIMNT